MASQDNEASSNGGGIGAVASSSSSSSSLAAVTQSSGMFWNFIGLFVMFTKKKCPPKVKSCRFKHEITLTS